MSDLSANEGEQELTGDNVFHWKQLIKAKLLQHDCWSVVGDEADLTGSDNDWDMTIPQQVRERTQLNRKREKKAMGLKSDHISQLKSRMPNLLARCTKRLWKL
jgi:hypothetical protein